MPIDSSRLAQLSRYSALKMVYKSGASHIASSLSCIDLLAVLYSRIVDLDKIIQRSADRDIVVMSKGHAAAGYLSVLAHVGLIPAADLETYCADGSQLGGHVTADGVLPIEFSTGSLGHGLPFGVGHALGIKRERTRARVYVVMSDGEWDEGSNWEAALQAAHFGLDGLTVLVDRNGLQSLTTTEDTLALEPFSEKLQAFRWSVAEVDGHDHEALTAAIQDEQSKKPRALICRTTKGKGVSFMEDQVEWHYRSPSEKQFEEAIAELGF
jgi:transketolase